MNDPTALDAQRLLVREISTLVAEINALPDDEMLWACPKGIANPIGTLGLHLAGNLRHFIGIEFGDTGYVRDRTREFESRGPTRQDVIDELADTVKDIELVIPQITVRQLSDPVMVGGVEMPGRRFLLHLCSHAALHVGQAGYLRRILTGNNESVGVSSIKRLES
ncbi:MAG: hypothetical protein ACI9W4_000433 [Rhodothermales bacterium]|jgi:hypothetical protein